MMTEKRYSYFKSQLTGLYVICDGKHKETFSGIDDEYNCSRIVRKLNILTDENEQLKREKERYKLLSEIRDENINNRILSLKDFINNCEDEKVKNILTDLFYSEVKEYDLAKENRKLKRDNEQLKKDVELWKQVARQYSNELNVFEHCKKYKTECKDIYWSSD